MILPTSTWLPPPVLAMFSASASRKRGKSRMRHYTEQVHGFKRMILPHSPVVPLVLAMFSAPASRKRGESRMKHYTEQVHGFKSMILPVAAHSPVPPPVLAMFSTPASRKRGECRMRHYMEQVHGFKSLILPVDSQNAAHGGFSVGSCVNRKRIFCYQLIAWKELLPMILNASSGRKGRKL